MVRYNLQSICRINYCIDVKVACISIFSPNFNFIEDLQLIESYTKCLFLRYTLDSIPRKSQFQQKVSDDFFPFSIERPGFGLSYSYFGINLQCVLYSTIKRRLIEILQTEIAAKNIILLSFDHTVQQPLKFLLGIEIENKLVLLFSLFINSFFLRIILISYIMKPNFFFLETIHEHVILFNTL